MKKSKIITKQNFKSFAFNNIAHIIAYIFVGCFGSSITTWLMTKYDALNIHQEWVNIILSLLISIVSWLTIVGCVCLVDFIVKTKRNMSVKLSEFIENKNRKAELDKQRYIEECKKKNTVYHTVEKVVIKEVHVPTKEEILINKIKNEKDLDNKIKLYKELKKEVGI